jgi:quinohemoprotein ethanol dehydrogenase
MIYDVSERHLVREGSMKKGLFVGVAAFAAISATMQLVPGSPAPAASPAAMHVGAGAEWRGINGDTAETGFSTLDQITPDNANRLGLAWTLELPGEASLEASPIMVDGTMYFTGAYSTVYAVNALSGELLWKFEPRTWQHNPSKMNYGFGANRGAAYDNGKIFSAAQDGRLFALDAKTGRMIWSVETTDPKDGRTITGAPRVFNGKVIIGQGGADFGMRGYVTAYDQETGNQAWRFYVVPGSPEQNKGDRAMLAAARTWNGEFWKTNGGGGGPWDNMTFDAELNRIYVGTANAYDYDPEKRSPGGGDNLYTASIVALDANTGKYVWHYQVNPRDSWDFDATQQMTLATLTIGGKRRKVLMQAPKNGFFYVLDRVSGRVISAGQIGKQTWAKGIDLKTGRPIENPNIRYEKGPVIIYPSGVGAHGWMRMAYAPTTGLVYVPTMQLGGRYFRGEPADDEVAVGGLVIGNHAEPGDATGKLVAWDPVAQKARWSVANPTVWNGGVVATAGNVVFQGTADGWFTAYDARDGKQLWRAQVGMGIIGSPMTYSLGGKQYVSVLAGYGGTAGMYKEMNVGWKYSGPRRLLTWTLDGKAAMPDSPAPTLQVNALDNPAEKLDPKAIATGKAIFMACAACHGKATISAGGPAPDLRESPIPLDPVGFYSVVHEGALMERGMPRFNFLPPDRIEAIRQYIRSEGRKAATQK